MAQCNLFIYLYYLISHLCGSCLSITGLICVIFCYCIVSTHLYSTSHSAHQSKVISAQETQRKCLCVLVIINVSVYVFINGYLFIYCLLRACKCTTMWHSNRSNIEQYKCWL